MLSLSLNVGITTARSAFSRSLSFVSEIVSSYQARLIHPRRLLLATPVPLPVVSNPFLPPAALLRAKR